MLWNYTLAFTLSLFGLKLKSIDTTAVLLYDEIKIYKIKKGKEVKSDEKKRLYAD
jgi:hypothetical protein